MSVLVLDAGALIALEGNDRALWLALNDAALEEGDVIVPSTVVAQVWRGHPKQAWLGRVLSMCSVAPFDPLARRVGELCGKARTRDVCDAHVALVAASAEADVVYTSDAADIRHLLRMMHLSEMPKIIHC